jgi:hypothetical protein
VRIQEIDQPICPDSEFPTSIGPIGDPVCLNPDAAVTARAPIRGASD